jgi:hypothetical protein
MFRSQAHTKPDEHDSGQTFDSAANRALPKKVPNSGNHCSIKSEPSEGHQGEYASKEQKRRE